MAAHQAPPSLGFSRQKHWSGLPFPSPMSESEKWKWSRSVVSDSEQPHGPQPTRLLRPWDFPGKSTGVGCHCLLQSVWLVRVREEPGTQDSWFAAYFLSLEGIITQNLRKQYEIYLQCRKIGGKNLEKWKEEKTLFMPSEHFSVFFFFWLFSYVTYTYTHDYVFR